MSSTLGGSPRSSGGRFRAVWFGALALTACLALSSGLAHATGYWVSPTGNDANSGADEAHPKTLGWFNVHALAGDICYLASGTYDTPIHPDYIDHSVNGTPSQPIVYRSATTVAGDVVVPDIILGALDGSWCRASTGGSYVDVRYVTSQQMTGFPGCYEFQPVGSSIVGCVGTAVTNLAFNGRECRMDSCSISGSVTGANGQVAFVTMDGGGSPGSPSTPSLNNRLLHTSFNVLVNTAGDCQIVHTLYADYNTLFANTFNVTVQSCSGYFFGIELYESQQHLIQSNVFDFNLTGAIGGSRAVWSMRDSSCWNRFVANDVRVHGAGGNLSVWLGHSGKADTEQLHIDNLCNSNYWGNNAIRLESPAGGFGALDFNNARFDGDTLEFNTVATAGPVGLRHAGGIGSALTNCVIRHNTFCTSASPVIQLTSADNGGTRLVSNACYSADGGNGSPVLDATSSTGLDSSGVYFALGGSAATALRVGGVSGAPGSGGGYGQTQLAIWGDPYFQDSTVAAFDAHPRVGSAALSRCLFDGYAGAFDGIDDIAPGTVTSLVMQTGKTNMTLSWTAPGDDGTCGAAVEYDLRYSKQMITSANFGSAWPISTGPPGTAGTAECYMKFPLDPCVMYFAALKTKDASGNWSAMSNVVGMKTKCGQNFLVLCPDGELGARPPVADELPMAMQLHILQANPSVGPTAIEYVVPQERDGADFDISVFDLLGRRVAQLAGGRAQAGVNSLEWDPRRQAAPAARAGLYYIRFRLGEQTLTRTVTVLR